MTPTNCCHHTLQGLVWPAQAQPQHIYPACMHFTHEPCTLYCAWSHEAPLQRRLNNDTLTATNTTQQLINTTSAQQPAVVLQNHPCSWHQHHNHHPAEIQPSHTTGMQHNRCQHSATRMRHTQMAQEGTHLLAGAFLHLACTPYARSWATP